MKLTSYRNHRSGRSVFAVHNHGPAAEAEVSHFIEMVIGSKPVVVIDGCGTMSVSVEQAPQGPLLLTIPPRGFLVADSTLTPVLGAWSGDQFLKLHENDATMSLDKINKRERR